jgi:uncharacterized membrane protein YeaQ/YmgE (transglycosylase-associated protein family)
MKKSTILIMIAMILIGWISNVSAAEILGYPVVEKQARFYTLILSIIGASIGLVGLSHLSFWLIELKKKAAKPTLRKEKEAFAELAAAAQSAK